MAIGIKEARVKKGYSQENLARLLEISVRTYQKIEAKEDYLPNIVTGLKLAKLLEVDPYEIWQISLP